MSKEKYINTLFIFDDVISTIYKNRRAVDINNFIFNRRHLIPNGMVSVIITSQKYNFIPSSIRSNVNLFISFRLNNIDWKTVEDEIIFGDDNFDNITNYVFNIGEDSSPKFLIYRTDNNKYFKNFDKIIF